MIDKLTKADIARRNGALSRGPKTPEGKAISSRNAFKHGLTAQNFLSTPAEVELFRQHLDALVDFWNPQCSYEHYLVQKLACPACPPKPWRRRKIQRAFHSIDETGALILGYRSLDEHSTSHRNMDRHVARLSRERVRALAALENAQARRARAEKEADAETQKFQVEPTPEHEINNLEEPEPLCPAA
ncbi:MAG: hypothetical protein JNK87_41100 [Bryobacterales bacterium]|nr:hypothetical protein [Bryobacterales bacterium]